MASQMTSLRAVLRTLKAPEGEIDAAIEELSNADRRFSDIELRMSEMKNSLERQIADLGNRLERQIADLGSRLAGVEGELRWQKYAIMTLVGVVVIPFLKQAFGH